VNGGALSFCRNKRILWRSRRGLGHPGSGQKTLEIGQPIWGGVGRPMPGGRAMKTIAMTLKELN